MTTLFTCRGCVGYCFQWTPEHGNPPAGTTVGDWVAGVWLAEGVRLSSSARTASVAKSRVRRKLDAVWRHLQQGRTKAELTRKRRAAKRGRQ